MEMIGPIKTCRHSAASVQAQRQPPWFDDARRRCLLSKSRRQCSDVRGPRLYRSTLDGTVMVYDGVAEFRQGRAAALLTSVLAGDDRVVKTSVQAVNKQPSAPVRHPHLPAGFRNRAVLIDQFHQLDLARPDSATRIEVNAQRQSRQGLAAG